MKVILPLPASEVLSERLIYNPLTGDLIWRACGRQHFKRERAWKRFHNCVAGKIAGHKHKHRGGKRHSIVIRMALFTVDGWYLAHRLIYRMMVGDIPEGMEIDHENGDPWDNRWSNLRLATSQQNGFNKPSSGRKSAASSGLPKGVSIHQGRFKAQISVGGKKRHIGMFGTPEEAAEAYRREAQPIHGEFLHVSCRP